MAIKDQLLGLAPGTYASPRNDLGNPLSFKLAHLDLDQSLGLMSHDDAQTTRAHVAGLHRS
jgi:hypothetical protein